MRRRDSGHVQIAGCGDENSATSVAQRFRGKEATEYRQNIANRLWLSKWNCRTGSDQCVTHMKVKEVAEAKEGRLMELDIRNAGMSPETADDYKEMDRRLVLIACSKRGAKNYVSRDSSHALLVCMSEHEFLGLQFNMST